MSLANRARWGLYAITVLYWITAFILTHIPPSEVPKTRVGDKYLHFFAYFVLCSLLYLCLWSARRSPGVSAGIVFAIGCIYGAFDELTQPLVGRSNSLRDWFANLTGAIAAIALFSLVRLIIPRRHD